MAAQLAVGASDVVTIHAILASSHTGPLVNTATVKASDAPAQEATFTSGTGTQADLSTRRPRTPAPSSPA
jgi:hypothetical protein